jgi:hypothetical protein
MGKYKIQDEEFALHFDTLLPFLGEFIGKQRRDLISIGAESMQSDGISLECL